MESLQATQKTKKHIRQLKRDLDLHSDDKVLQLLLSNYKDTPKESIKHKQSIRSQVLHLMNDGDTWQLADLVTEVSKNVKQDSNTIKRFIKSILDTVLGITKVGDARYRLSKY